MKLDDGCVAANRAMSPNDLVAYDDVDQPGNLFVCNLHSPKESTIISGRVPSGSGCENPAVNHDFDFDTVSPELVGFSDGISGYVFGQTSLFHKRQSYSPLQSYPASSPQSDVSRGSDTEDTEGEKQWGFIVRTL